mmetsp:Transcript_41437/g.129768  ORF Transcript_41437/g.129768 Transcript_41437/m.129768 type:complete len:317 (-) Transcript_41437:983-1933(-)
MSGSRTDGVPLPPPIDTGSGTDAGAAAGAAADTGWSLAAAHPGARGGTVTPLRAATPKGGASAAATTPDNLTEAEEAEELERLRLETKYVRFKVSDINQHVTCRLCNGYFRDAHTISECLHTFCKSCLWLQLNKGEKKCPWPMCSTDLGNNPSEFIMADRDMQCLVDKLFPHLRDQDAAGEEEFYRQKGIPLKPDQDKSAAAGGSKDGSRKRRRTNKEARKEMNVKLIPDTTCAESRRLKELTKPYLRTSIRLKMMQLQKYLRKKLGIGNDEETQGVELVCRGSPVGAELSLEFIGRVYWVDEGPTLILHYRRPAN